MAMVNPKGRANYEPNSWGTEGGPRENPTIGFHSYPEEISGEKRRIRAESFADHYSQARQFYISQTPIEQDHIADALVFELSKVEKVAIRERVVSHLLNIDQTLANKVIKELGLRTTPKPAIAAKPTNTLLKKSPALSIILNGPNSFAGRKIGVLLTNNADADIYQQLSKILSKEKVQMEIIAPQIGGCKLNDGKHVEAQQNIKGGPSVLYDAIVLLISKEGARELAKESAARDFISDAYHHSKFIAYTAEATALFESAGVADELDEGCVLVNNRSSLQNFLNKCKDIRVWSREQKK